MKNLLCPLILLCTVFSCSKSNGSGSGTPVKTTCTTQVTIGDLTYHTSNYSVEGVSVDDYLFDGLTVIEHFPVIRGNALEISVADTVNGGSGTIKLLVFMVPSYTPFANYQGRLISMNVNNVTYSGRTTVSADLTGNGANNKVGGDSTINGTFNLNGLVSDGLSADSVSFSATVTFTNTPH